MAMILTHTNRLVDPFNLAPEDIDIQDIAHALAHLCRWGGHCSRFYSVAEHSLAVTRLCPPELKLSGLLHDASEAYLLDIPHPVKRHLPEYLAAECRAMRAIFLSFGLDLPLSPEIKDIDHKVLVWESRHLGMVPVIREPNPYPNLSFPEARTCHSVEVEFLNEFTDLHPGD